LGDPPHILTIRIIDDLRMSNSLYDGRPQPVGRTASAPCVRATAADSSKRISQAFEHSIWPSVDPATRGH